MELREGQFVDGTVAPTHDYNVSVRTIMNTQMGICQRKERGKYLDSRNLHFRVIYLTELGFCIVSWWISTESQAEHRIERMFYKGGAGPITFAEAILEEAVRWAVFQCKDEARRKTAVVFEPYDKVKEIWDALT